MYYPDRFSVCGTDLTEEDSTLYGISAKKGYYGGSQIWTYIAAGDYAIWNNISDGTFQLYRDDIELMIDSVSIADPKLNAEEKLAIVLGTEGDGLADSTIEGCDYTVKIPMTHGVDSLNVAAASAVAFWQLGRR